MRTISLYVHVPFCRRRCSYCTFYHVAHDDSLERPFVEALVNEFETAAAEVGEPFYCPTVYFGGGTPSILSRDSLETIFRSISPHLRSGATEITFETNPEDVTLDLLRKLKAHGVNRLSLGVQSMDPRSLRTLERCSAAVNRAAVEEVKRHFENYSLDVLLGIPDASPRAIRHTVDAIVDYAPPHVSVYCLEPGGEMENDVRDFLCTVDSERSAEEYLFVCETMREKGYVHYEISNFARAGYESRHNQVYWEGGDYIGIGPAAHSYLGGERYRNEPSIERYLAPPDGVTASTRVLEPRGEEARRLEDLMLALRTHRGLALSRVDCERAEVDGLVEERLVRICGDRVVLTDRGFLVLNDILLRLARVA